MRRVFVAALTVGLVAGLAPRAAAADDPKEIIKKAVAAAGGAEKIDKFQGFKSTSKGTLSLLGMELEISTDTTFQAPDKLKTVATAELMGNKMTIEQKVLGTKVTFSINGMSQELPDAMKEELRKAMVSQKMMTLTPLLNDTSFELKSIGEAKVDGKDAVGVSVSSKDMKDVKLYFDKSTHLLAKIERTGLDPTGMGGEVKQELILSGYKEFNGVKKPTKTVMMQDGKKIMEGNTTEMKLVEKIDDKEFSD